MGAGDIYFLHAKFNNLFPPILIGVKVLVRWGGGGGGGGGG
jgi:hypothetical protein